MRTKTLLLTAAVTAVGIATSTAQVFSVNTVGYVRRSVPSGFSMIANPLKNGGNKVSDLFAGVPGATIVYTFNNATSQFTINQFDPDFGWDLPDQVLNPGTGAWIRTPSATEVTFVGEVEEGQLDVAVGVGFNLVASRVPQAGKLQADLKYTPNGGDIVYFHRTGSFEIYQFDPDFGWDPAEPTVNVGDGFFIRTAAASTWSRTFTVN